MATIKHFFIVFAFLGGLLAHFQVIAGFRAVQGSSGWSIDWDAKTMQATPQWMPATGAQVGNTGFVVEGGTLKGASTYRAPLGPGYIDVAAKTVIDRPSLATAIGNFAKKVATPLAIGSALYDLAKDAGFIVDDGKLYKLDPSVCTGSSSCLRYYDPYKPQILYTTPDQACASFGLQYPSSYDAYFQICRFYNNGVYTFARDVRLINIPPVTNPSSFRVNASFDDLSAKIASESGWPSTNTSLPRAAAEAIQSGEPVSASVPTLSGPSTVAGPTTTTVSGVTTETKQTIYNITYNNNNATYNTTTTTTTNTGGVVTTKTETTTNDKPLTFCQQNPDALSCRELDTPDETIPKTTKNIVFAPESWFGGGTCPADKYLTLKTGQVLKVWDWQQSCTFLTSYFRPILLICASIVAMFIVLPKVET